ncbi:substrate-binding domain-containing protein [Candidatus Poriferisocius sp.]|uniref:substrate-binding domain-containing protein n=1 Tax=Candidatus Poriferisocius sp. TaxID=3101276 RepID=UPI003B015DA6
MFLQLVSQVWGLGLPRRGGVRGVAVAAVLAVALLASGCGSGGDGGGSAPSPAAVESSPEAVDASDSGVGDGGGGDEPAPEESEEMVEAPPAAATAAPTAAPVPLGPPHTAELPWGDFALAERIAAKLADGQQLNFVLSANATGSGGSGEVMGLGWEQAASGFGADINPRVIGPNSADRAAQIETIDSLIGSGSIDCLAVEVDDPAAFVEVIDRAVDAGIPTFTVGGDSADSKRFAFYGLDDRAAGKLVGAVAGEWAAERRILMRKAAVLTANVDDPRYQARMQGFVEGLLEIHSGIEFINGPDMGIESLGFDPDEVYAATEAWVLANPDADMIFHTDQGMAQLARVIADQLLYGDMYTSGFHMNEDMANYLRDGVVVAAVAQGLSNQANSAGAACGQFLLQGAHETGHVVQEPLIATESNVDTVDWTQPENQ